MPFAAVRIDPNPKPVKSMARRFLKSMPATSIVIAFVHLLLAACSFEREFPKMVTRDEWKAQKPNLNSSSEHGIYDPVTNLDGWLVYNAPLKDVLNTVVVHHSALPPTQGANAIQKIHMSDRGFADIGYHFVIDTDGIIFEGREISVRGAHTAGHNTGAVGIVLLGNFENKSPSEKQFLSLQRLVRALVSRYGITHIAGHKDFQSAKTQCPGEELEKKIPALADELGLTFGSPN